MVIKFQVYIADSLSMKINRPDGFTLIELLVTLSIAGILLGIGVPSFSNAISESRISSQYNAMVGSLYLARSEAVKGPGEVTVCPKSAVEVLQCGSKTDWKNGWIVFIDRTTVQGEAEATIDANDEILSHEAQLKGQNTILAIGSNSNAAADAAEVAFVRYVQDGGTLWDSGSFIVCDAARGALYSRSINLVLTGDIRRGRVSSGSDSPRDVFNRPISNYCSEPSGT